MKTTIELPDALFRRAKSAAAEQGRTLKDFFTEAFQDRLWKNHPGGHQWEEAFGKLKHLQRENRHIERLIADEFETIDPEEWR